MRTLYLNYNHGSIIIICRCGRPLLWQRKWNIRKISTWGSIAWREKKTIATNRQKRRKTTAQRIDRKFGKITAWRNEITWIPTTKTIIGEFTLLRRRTNINIASMNIVNACQPSEIDIYSRVRENFLNIYANRERCLWYFIDQKLDYLQKHIQ